MNIILEYIGRHFIPLFLLLTASVFAIFCLGLFCGREGGRGRQSCLSGGSGDFISLFPPISRNFFY